MNYLPVAVAGAYSWTELTSFVAQCKKDNVPDEDIKDIMFYLGGTI